MAAPYECTATAHGNATSLNAPDSAAEFSEIMEVSPQSRATNTVPPRRATEPRRASKPRRKTRSRKVGLGNMRQWHWVSSAVCLVGMLLFSVTGITLNHGAEIGAEPQITTVEVQLPEDLLQKLAVEHQDGPIPAPVRHWLAREHGLDIPGRPAEWLDGEAYLALPRPGGDAWLSLNLHSGDVVYEKTTRGWIAYFNDLHKGRNTGTAWRWFIDIFALATVVFSATGLILLQRQANRRTSTWPLVGLGFVIPLLIAVFFIH
jgi:hypothetical protein